MSLWEFERHARGVSLIHRVDARVKLAALLFFILMVTSLSGAGWTMALYAALPLLATGAARVPLRIVILRALAVIPFAAMAGVFLPFMPLADGDTLYPFGSFTVSGAGLARFAEVTVKAFTCALCVAALSVVTPFSATLDALRRFGAPPAFVLTLSLAYRYLFTLREEAARMIRARDARGYAGRGLAAAMVAGGMMGALFLRTHERGERIYQAMAARGFSGAASSMPPAPLQAADWVFLTLSAAGIALIRIAAL